MVFLRSASLVLLAVLGFTKPMAAQSTDRISDADISQDGTVKIRFSSGQSVRIPRGKGQTGREQVQVAASGTSVGWLDVDAPVGSYSVPTTLTVYRVGKPFRHLGDG